MRGKRQARDKVVSDAKKIQKTAPEHRWGGRTIFARAMYPNLTDAKKASTGVSDRPVL
jgi:hypothetical protein